MGKHNKVDKPVLVRFYLPTSYKTRLDFLLFSEVEKKVPFGAYTELLSKLVKDYLNKIPKNSLPQIYEGNELPEPEENP